MSNPTAYDMTLDEFSAQLDEYLSRTSGFADDVRRLYVLNARRAQVNAAKAAGQKILRASLETTGRSSRAAQTPGGDWVIESKRRARRPSAGSVVRKKYPSLYRSCVVPSAYAQVKYGREMVIEPVPGLPVFPADPQIITDHLVAVTVEGLSQISAKGAALLPPIEAEIKAVKARLGAVCEAADWDGLPVAFTDAWTVGLRRMQFKESVFRDRHPDEYGRVMAVVEELPDEVVTDVKLRPGNEGELDTYAE
ncbi:hypothetical protein SEA_NHAGOS_58 [Gordonia phage NHagos]|nr:hypothetical protein SEA_NHAGOS_58 [Gordonia phage NHagos]